MRKIRELPPLDMLNECFYLLNGSLIWRERPLKHFTTQGYCDHWNKRFAGKNACVEKGMGYRHVCISGKRYTAHRVIFYMHTGINPGELFIDHADGNRHNDLPENLRLATQSQNSVNFKGPRADNVYSGCRGVSWNRGNKKWEAWATCSGKRKYLGLFTDKNEAATVAHNARLKEFGEFYGG